MQTQRMHVDHQLHRSGPNNESLTDRVLQIGKTLVELRKKLATEKEILKQERMMTASMYMLPTTNEYYTLFYPRSESAGSGMNYRDKEEPILPEQTFHEGYTTMPKESRTNTAINSSISENLFENLSLTVSERNFIEREKKKVMLSKIHAYTKHLKAVENKCKAELGAVTESLCCLKKVSTQLSIKVQNKEHYDQGHYYEDY